MRADAKIKNHIPKLTSSGVDSSGGTVLIRVEAAMLIRVETAVAGCWLQVEQGPNNFVRRDIGLKICIYSFNDLFTKYYFK